MQNHVTAIMCLFLAMARLLSFFLFINCSVRYSIGISKCKNLHSLRHLCTLNNKKIFILYILIFHAKYVLWTCLTLNTDNSIISFRDIRMKVQSWAASGTETGQSTWTGRAASPGSILVAWLFFYNHHQ